MFPQMKPPHSIGCGDPGDTIEFGCRFDSGQYLSFVPSQSGNDGRWSVAYWIKRLQPISSQDMVFAFGSGSGIVRNYFFNNRLSVVDSESSQGAKTTQGYQRDFAGFYHVMIRFDNSIADVNQRCELFINLKLVGRISLNTAFSLNKALAVMQAGKPQYIGFGNGFYLKGILADFIFLDDKAPEPDEFGYINSYGHVVPRTFTGKGQGASAYGVSGSHLDFNDPDDLGKDVSGNGNHWTSVNLSPESQTRDTPSSSLQTLSPLRRTEGAGEFLKEGNTFDDGPVSGGSGGRMIAGDFLISSGKWYCEAEATKAVSFFNQLGIVATSVRTNRFFVGRFGPTDGYGYDGFDGKKKNISNSDSGLTYGDAYTAGDVIGIAFDADNGKLFFRKNGVWQGGGNPETGANPAFENISGTYHFASAARGAGYRWNFGHHDFVDSAPEGFLAPNKPNLPCPVILDPKKYVARFERSAGADVSELEWNPQVSKTLVIMKRLDGTGDHIVVDTVNGAGKHWSQNDPSQGLQTDSTAIIAFTDDGYSVGSHPALQSLRLDRVHRASPESGFDIVNVTKGSGAATVSHWLGAPVEYAWIVPHNGGDIRVFHHRLSPGDYLRLNSNSGASSDSADWFVSTADDLTLDGSLPAGKYTVYARCSVYGFSAFDEYVGNGNASDGPMILTDFAPGEIDVKYKSGSTASWRSWNKTRSPENPANEATVLNSDQGEFSGSNEIDLLSNGFKCRDNANSMNASGVRYIFAALAETPVKFSRGQ